jgi:glycerol-3-phosphate O-acyltransferase
MDCVPRLSRAIYRQGYDEQIVYDAEDVARLQRALADRPGVILMSHRSNLDAGVAAAALLDTNLPRAHGLAGDNMRFWPVGPIVRRAGVIFIRRAMSDDPVYRHVLREYVGYLLEKRFNLQWAIEGTRSRTGKMMPPKLGLLAYVVDAYRSGRVDDVVLAPVSIAYDRLGEIGEFAAYANGDAKRKEGVGWLIRFARSQRRDYGRIYVNFAAPVSLRDRLGPPGADGKRDPNELAKLAIEVARRINDVTPITAAALLTLVLLGADGRALTLPQLQAELHDLLDFAARRALPITASARGLASEDGILPALADLEAHGVVSALPDGRAPVWRIAPDQQLAASFYRNSLVHFVLEPAVAELALARVATAGRDEAGAADPEAMFWEAAHALRKLFTFDFFFAGRAEFAATIEADLSLVDPDWRDTVAGGPTGALELLTKHRPLTAHVALRSFIEAYHVVADVLCADGAGTDQAALLDRCLAVSRQFQWQGQVTTAESVSRYLLSTGVQVAAHRGLLSDDADVVRRRRQHECELRQLVVRVRLIQELSARRVTDLIDDVQSPTAL